jgi:hypothetical protein
MKIEAFPNTLTEFDKKQIDILKFNLTFSPYRYVPEETFRVIIKDITNQDDYTGTVEFIEFDIMAANFQKSHVYENVPLDELEFLPINQSVFKSYKSELVVLSYFDSNNQPNVNNEIIVDHLMGFVEKHDHVEYVNSNFKIGDLLIICPSTGTFVNYLPEDEHCFHIDISGLELQFDSLDLALKACYEWAKNECDYKSKSSAARIAKFQEYLDSPEGEASVKAFFEEEDRKAQEKLDFFESERFNEIYTGLLNELKERGCLSGSSMQYGKKSPVLTESEFYLFTGSIFLTNDCKEDEDAMFSTEFVLYKNLRIERVHGQGTETSITLIN